MRLSGMGGFQMVAWRGLCMGAVMIGIWLILSQHRRRDIGHVFKGSGLTVIMCQFFNSICFCLGVALAPVAFVLLGVATVPVFAALLAWIILRERARPATWGAIIAVALGIGIAVSGDEGGFAQPNLQAIVGVGFGLVVAFVLALNFVVIRVRPDLPILLMIGCGAIVAGSTGLAITGNEMMTDGRIWPIVISGAFLLPVSIFMLSYASRFTQAANVSLLMLLETVLGPYWVWLGIGEQPTVQMLLGGGVVIGSLAIYLWVTGRDTSGAPSYR